MRRAAAFLILATIVAVIITAWKMAIGPHYVEGPTIAWDHPSDIDAPLPEGHAAATWFRLCYDDVVGPSCVVLDAKRTTGIEWEAKTPAFLIGRVVRLEACAGPPTTVGANCTPGDSIMLPAAGLARR